MQRAIRQVFDVSSLYSLCDRVHEAPSQKSRPCRGITLGPELPAPLPYTVAAPAALRFVRLLEREGSLPHARPHFAVPVSWQIPHLVGHGSGLCPDIVPNA